MTDTALLPGTPVTDDELRALGFVPLNLEFTAAPVPLEAGTGCLWTTVGDVPDSPGLYAFTVAAGDLQHVTYVGRTGHLWMVTKACFRAAVVRGPDSATAARSTPASRGNA